MNPKSSNLLLLLLEFLETYIFSLAIFNFLWMDYWSFRCVVTRLVSILLSTPNTCLHWHQSCFSQLQALPQAYWIPIWRATISFFLLCDFSLGSWGKSLRTMSENILVVSPIVRAKSIGSWIIPRFQTGARCCFPRGIDPTHSRQCSSI